LHYILDDIDLITVMTVNPGFAGQPLVPSTMRKLRDVRKLLDDAGKENIDIEVDGNVSFENIPFMVSAGATMLVGGTSSIFSRQHSISGAIAMIRALVEPRPVI
jgi:ribulose-phosphate 3-epimerase